jgi:hypothetical protein
MTNHNRRARTRLGFRALDVKAPAAFDFEKKDKSIVKFLRLHAGGAPHA